MDKRKIIFEYELIEATINFNRDETITFEFDLPKRLDQKGLKDLSHVIEKLELYLKETK